MVMEAVSDFWTLNSYLLCNQKRLDSSKGWSDRLNLYFLCTQLTIHGSELITGSYKFILVFVRSNLFLFALQTYV